jgi:hypothetical protein
MRRVFSLALVLGLAAVQSASAATVFYDFGDSSQQSSAATYNNVTVNPPNDTLNLLNSIDSTGASTGITLAMSGFFTGSNQNGPTTPTGDAAIFSGQATRDNAFGHAAAFGVNPLTPMGTVVFGGLDGSGATAYDFTFFASRTGVADNREALYSLTGANSGSTTLNASGNTSQVATAAGIIPTSAGVITLNVSPTANNTSASKFYYLGALRLVSSSAIPEPTSLVIAGLAGATLLFRRR